MHKVYVYSGPTKSGKTTKLMQWAATQKNLDGIFQPVIDSKRFLYHISSRTLRELETDANGNNITIGNYKFSVDSFIWAGELILNAVNNELDWLIIDEVGPLELEGKGLEPFISKVFEIRENYKFKIICVVREKLLDRFLTHYKLENSFQKFEVA